MSTKRRGGRYLVPDLSQSWTRYLRANDKSQFTIRNYERTLRLLSEWLDEHDVTTDVREIDPDDLTDFIQHVRDTTSANNSAHHYRNVRAFFSWLVDEKTLTRQDDPMADVPRPRETRVKRPAIPLGEADKLLKACSGSGFLNRRDTAIIRVFLDTGVRARGLLGMRYEQDVSPIDNRGQCDVFLDHEPPLVRFRLKGGKQHLVDITPKTVLALDRYLRERSAHRFAHLSGLWLTSYGQISKAGLQGVLDRRAEKAGISHIHPHRFRRTMATWGLDGGQGRETVKRRGGWESDTMVGLYASDSEERRAWAESQRLKVADQV